MKKLDINATELGRLAHMLRKVEFFTPLTIGQVEKILPAIMLHSYDTAGPFFPKARKALPSTSSTKEAWTSASAEMTRIAARRTFAISHQAES